MTESERARLVLDMRWSIEQARFILRLLDLPWTGDKANTENLYGQVKMFRGRLTAAESDMTLAVIRAR